MKLQDVLDMLTNCKEFTFYECGSRAVAKRIGTDGLTKAMLDEAERQFNLPLKEKLKTIPARKEPTLAEEWLHNKPIITTEETDYDFFAQFSSEITKWLEQHDFVPTWYSMSDRGDIDYRDELCAAVYEHEDHNIQVVLRDDALLYKAIFDNIPHDVYHDYLWKSSSACPNRTDIRKWFDTFANIAKAVQELK